MTQSPDTDITVLAVAHFKDLGCQELWLQTGAKDKERYIPLHTIHSSLGPSLCKCLPSFHALTECDSTSAFAEIEKNKALEGVNNERSVTVTALERILYYKNQYRAWLNLSYALFTFPPKAFRVLMRHDIFSSVREV